MSHHFYDIIGPPAGINLAVKVTPVLGYNPDIGNTLEDISELGVEIIPVPGGDTDTPIALEVVSTSADDSAAGSGIQLVEIHTLMKGVAKL